MIRGKKPFCTRNFLLCKQFYNLIFQSPSTSTPMTNYTMYKRLVGHTTSVRCLAKLNDDDQRIATGSGDELIKIWNITTETVWFTLEGHNDWVMALIQLNNEMCPLASS